MPYCTYCGAANVNGAVFCKSCGTITQLPVAVRVTDDRKALRCKCGSTQLHAEKRGFSLWSGFIGSRKIIVTCLACGRRYRPGYLPNDRSAMREPMDRSDVLFGLIIVGMFLLTLLFAGIMHRF